MGTRSCPIYVQPWQGTLRAMKAAGTRVQLAACRCSSRPAIVELDVLADRVGEDADLWDRTMRCESCGAERHYPPPARIAGHSSR